MKNLLIFLLYFAFSSIYAQNYEIQYDAFVRQKFNEEQKKHFDNSEMGRAQMKANEEPPIENYKLIVSGKESSFTYQDRINNNQDQSFDIRFAPAGFGTYYRSLIDSVQKRDFDVYGKAYHSIDSLKQLHWKITRESKEILGYKVYKAVLEDSISITTAWFTPKIQISSGPSEYWGLPGLILELEKSSKTRIYTVNYVAKSLKEIKNPKMIIPQKGTRIKEMEIDGIFEEANKKRQELYLESQGVNVE